jgi:putative oxidoreductase
MNHSGTTASADVRSAPTSNSGLASTFFRIGGLVQRANSGIGTVALYSPFAWILRVALAVPFWKSGILKWSSFGTLSDSAVDLFSSEFMLHLPGGPYPYPAPVAMAYVTGTLELLLPTLLVMGLATRFAAIGLLIMTTVVELTVTDGWPIHITWAAMALAVMARGPGMISLDYLIARLVCGRVIAAVPEAS